jgi:hypothetical protein
VWNVFKKEHRALFECASNDRCSLAMLNRDPDQSWQDSTNFGQGPGQMNVPKRRVVTMEEETTTSTTTTTTPVEEEAMATTKRTTGSKEIVIIAAKKGIPKQHAGCSRVMLTRDLHGLNQETIEMKQELQEKKPATRLNTF